MITPETIGLQDCVSNILQKRDATGEEDLNQVVDQVQHVLLGPIMDNIRQSNPNAPDIAPAIGQILAGFRGLNAAISMPSPANPQTQPDMLD